MSLSLSRNDGPTNQVALAVLAYAAAASNSSGFCDDVDGGGGVDDGASNSYRACL